MPGSVKKRKAVLDELKLDSVNKQQVLDILQDCLTDVLSNLASSRAHAYEVQESYTSEHLTSQRMMADIQAAEIGIGELTYALKQQQKESLDAIASVGDLEARNKESKTKIGQLGEVVKENDSKATVVTSLETLISELQAVIGSHKEKLQQFESTIQENIQLKVVAEEKQSQLTSLESSHCQMAAPMHSQGAASGLRFNLRVQVNLQENSGQVQVPLLEAGKPVSPSPGTSGGETVFWMFYHTFCNSYLY
ncbi:hypothetical protein JB92DRAFT_3238996 [Gautieria morchelliformis]|nr:hypothetical protein JB92DRAFT_3238996 [Gautieria morchelliformis]